MVKDEDMCLHCGLVRRALPDRRLGHAEIPDRNDLRRKAMPASPISRVNDFVVRFANVNGSGSASANEIFARAVLRMGVPVSPRNIFPVQHPGPADLVRGAGFRRRAIWARAAASTSWWR